MLFFAIVSPMLAGLILGRCWRDFPRPAIVKIFSAGFFLGLFSLTANVFFDRPYFSGWSLPSLLVHYSLRPDFIYAALLALLLMLGRRRSTAAGWLLLLLGVYQGRALWEGLTVMRVELWSVALVVPLQRLIILLGCGWLLRRPRLKFLLPLLLLALVVSLALAVYWGQWQLLSALMSSVVAGFAWLLCRKKGQQINVERRRQQE